MFLNLVPYVCVGAFGAFLVFPNLRQKSVYYLRFSLYAVIMLFGSLFYCVKFVFKGPSYENGCDFKNVFSLSQRCLGLEPRFYGFETYDEMKQCIFVVNHQSFIDVLSLCKIWRLPSSVIAKDTLRYFGPIGAVMHYSKIIFVKRSSHEQAIEKMREAAESVKRDKVNMFMFPEGTRRDTGKLEPFKKGAFHLAIQTGVPIQPVVISCYLPFLDHKKKLFSPVPYGVYLLPPIETKDLTEADAGKLMEQTYSVMEPLFNATARASREELGSDLRKTM